MTTTLLPSRVEVQVDSLRESVERGDPDSVYTVARAAVATGVADPEIAARLGSGEEMSGDGLWDAVLRFLTNTTVEDQKRVRQTWRWPLFVLGCPTVEGAQTELSVATAQKGEGGWKLKLFGCGFERKTTLSVSDTVIGTAMPGQHRVLFAGHDVDVIEFGLVRAGRVISRGTRIEIAAGGGAVGWIDLPAAPAWLSPASKLVSLSYSAAAPSSQQQWSRQQDFAHNYELVLGHELAPVELGATLTYELTTTVNLRVTLPGGGDWDVVKPDRCAGMTVLAAGV